MEPQLGSELLSSTQRQPTLEEQLLAQIAAVKAGAGQPAPSAPVAVAPPQETELDKVAKQQAVLAGMNKLTPEKIAAINASIDANPFNKQLEKQLLEKQSALEGLIKNSNSGPDLTGLMAAFEHFGGVKPEASQIYKERYAPMTEQERNAAIAKAKTSAADNAIEMTKIKSSQFKDLTEASAKGGAPSESVIRTAEGAVDKELSNYEDNSKKFWTQADQLGQLLKTATVQSMGAAASQYARFIAGEKGVLTDKDTGRVIPPSIQQTIKSAQGWLNSGQAEFPSELVKPMKDMVDWVKDNQTTVDREYLTMKQKRLEANHLAKAGIVDVAAKFKPYLDRLDKIQAARGATVATPSTAEQSTQSDPMVEKTIYFLKNDPSKIKDVEAAKAWLDSKGVKY